MLAATVNGFRLPKVGFGTWRIGGRSRADPRKDQFSLLALRSALEIGYRHFDTAEMYANGHAEELLGQAIRDTGIARESLLIVSKVMPQNLDYRGVLQACARSLGRMRLDYLDLYLIHWPSSSMNLADSFRALNQLVSEGRVRWIGVSNFDVELLRQSQALSKTPIVTNQVPYSLGDRSYVKNGILEYCLQDGVVLTAYSPLEEGRLHHSKALRQIADAHRATQAQIAIAWLCNQPGVVTIPMSSDAIHQRQNLEAGSIVLTREEMAALN
jgi:diketogulonate reductase-like aldo/keto reductase